MNKNVFKVSQLNKFISRMFADDGMLSNLSVSGEVSNCKYNHTGHIYFTLKDDGGTISCVMFAGNRAKGLPFTMKDGDQVVVNGYVGVYEAAGKYQVYAKSIELAGAGNLYQKFEELKKRLEEMGMFDPSYKKPIPKFAKKIGIVTASTGAAVHDIIQVSKRRNPYVQLILYPAQVQGEGAAPSIISGLNALDNMDLDIIIVGRGGGSIEDLWAFNEEEVARAIFNCNTPIISAVGHEVDYTIADFVADKRAATPSQAAELANFVYDDFVHTLDRYEDKFNMAMDDKLSSYMDKLDSYNKQLKLLLPTEKLKYQMENLRNLYQRLNQSMNMVMDRYKNSLSVYAGKLDGVSPAKRLSEGFGYISDTDGNRIMNASQISVGQNIRTIIEGGAFESTITSIEKD